MRPTRRRASSAPGSVGRPPGSTTSGPAEPGSVAGTNRLRHDLDLHPVVRECYAFGGRQLGRAVREEEVARARGGIRLERLLGAQVAARLAVGLAGLERRLADEEVGVARELGDPLA